MNLRPRRIALMLESDGPGGAETMLMQLAEELRRRRHDVICVGPDNGCGWLGGELRRRGFITDVFSLRRPLDPACLRGMTGMLRRLRIDVVHSHEFTMAIYGAAAAHRLHIPHVVTMHGSDGRLYAKWRRRVALRMAFTASRSVVAVSRATHDLMVNSLGLAPESVRTIPNGIRYSPGEPTRVRQELRLAAEDQLVLAVGNLVPWKGHIHLLRALSRINGNLGARWHVAIAGAGVEETRLREFASAAGIDARVHLLGHRSDIPDLLAASDVFVMPSLREALPMALLEAMFAGKPVIASRAAGIPEVIVEGRDGLLAGPGDEVQLQQALEQLLGDEALRRRLGHAGRDRAAGEFSAAAMTDAYEQAYGIR